MPHHSCLCCYHENVNLLLKPLSKCINNPNLVSLQSFSKALVCNEDDENCMFNRCSLCANYFTDKFRKYVLNPAQNIQWYQWIFKNGYSEKQEFNGQEITSLADLKATSDLLIVANGSHSCLREQVPIKQSYQLYPYGCLWTTVEDDQITPNQLCQYMRYSQEMFGILPSGINENNKRIVSVFWSLPIKLKNIYCIHKVLEGMKFYLIHDNNYFIEKLSQANYSFAVYADVFMKQYDYENIIFIGDAAHGMSPQLGQGANMAFLDSYYLNKVLIENSNNITLALKNYTTLRRQHLKFYSQASKFLTPLYQSDQMLYGRFRDVLFTISKQMKFSRKISSQILCGKRTSWIRNQEIEY
ncbi:unnamed protein product [Rotaria sp. Silwood1]|nr:unnamed protein product [Rotaria sp. Silwood1]